MKEIHVVITDDSSYACADLKLSSWIDEVLASTEDTIKIATQLQLYALRVAHKNKNLKMLGVLTEHGDLIQVDEKGLLDHYPKGMVNLFDNYLDELIEWDL